MNGAGRVAWVTGTVVADISGVGGGEAGPNNGATGAAGTNNSSTHGTSRLSTGYIVGCQVDINGISGGISAAIDGTGPTASVSISVPVSAGQVVFVNLLGKDIAKDGVYTLEYQDTQIEVQDCGGYAQARAYTVVELTGNNYAKMTLYGQPFSIG